MQIILLEKVVNLGQLGDVVRVRDGYARNFLIPQGKARRATQAAVAEFEARRCLSCGNCFECDGCYGACPEDAVIKLGPGNRYRFDYERCTGCATCYEQCPVHAIEMIPEGQ